MSIEKTDGICGGSARIKGTQQQKLDYILWHVSQYEKTAERATEGPMLAKGWKVMIEQHLEVVGCFDAAFAEGLMELVHGQPSEVGSLADLMNRRIMYAKAAAESALEEIIALFESFHSPITLEMVERSVKG